MHINSVGQVRTLIDRYAIWRDHEKFYNDQDRPIIEHSDHGVPCYDYQDVDAINQDSAALVIIDALTESVHSLEVFARYRRDRRYVIFSGGWWDTSQHELPIQADVIVYPFFLFEMLDVYLSPGRFCFYLDREYDFDHASVTLLSLIGNVRPERDKLVHQLQHQFDRQDMILRYSGQDLAVTTHGLDVVSFDPGQFDPYTSILDRYYHNVSQTLPLHLMNQARVNLVVETDVIYQHSFFFTEKTFKVLVTGMPFVILATPGYLQRLRLWGFRTYHDIWDESYDQVLDLDQRIAAVVDVCCGLQHLDWHKHRAQLQHIQQHNRANMLNLAKIQKETFLEMSRILGTYQ